MLKIKMSLCNTEINEEHFVKLEENREIYSSLGDTELSVIGEFLCHFIKVLGYRFDNKYLLMKSLTEEELEYLEDCLYKYRKDIKGEE